MRSEVKTQGTWWQRFFIRLFTIFFAILIYWLLGFLVEDIQSIPGPEFSSVEKNYVDNSIVEKQKELKKQIGDLTVQIQGLNEKQKNLEDSSKNLQQTMSQLLELQKLAVQKGGSVSETDQTNYTSSLNLFLENQKSYQELSQSISEKIGKKLDLTNEKQQLDEEISNKRKPALKEYERLEEKHQLNLAIYQLAILLPILFLAIVLLTKMKKSIYFPLVGAFAGATLLEVLMVIYDYFPSKYFKYFFILALILSVAYLLIRFIRNAAFPKVQWLAQKYREGYERFLCPNCEYPIRMGPRRYLFWTRRTVNKIIVPSEGSEPEETYTCPSCGFCLFETCPSCQKVRHSLMPNCTHCGTQKEIE